MKLSLSRPDTFGALASAICLVHCLATPLIFIAHASSACCSASVPTWWKSIDYMFLVVSFFAVYRSTQTTSKPIMKPALWISWIALFAVIANENLALFNLPKLVSNIPALTLVVLHLYNLKYCQCKTDDCCTVRTIK